MGSMRKCLTISKVLGGNVEGMMIVRMLMVVTTTVMTTMTILKVVRGYVEEPEADARSQQKRRALN